MMWLRGILAARWFPFALIGIPAVVVVVFGWGYMKGSATAETKMLKKMNQALVEQAAQLQAAHTRQLAALQAKVRREAEAERIDDIPRPAGDLCDAGDEWLRAVQDGVRMSNSAAGAN